MHANETPAPLILLVEDYEANILVATLYLEDLGYRYEVARDGLQAVEMARSGLYDAILMDVKMPEFDGAQATRMIRESKVKTPDGTQPVPIIGMSAHVFATDRDRCMEAGMDDYLTKPVQQEILAAKIAQFTK